MVVHGVNRIEPQAARGYGGREPGPDPREADPMSETPVTEMTFEQAMKALEDVVGRLERGDVALEESIRLYERGAELKKRCEAKLREAEEKVAQITLDPAGNPTGATPVEDR